MLLVKWQTLLILYRLQIHNYYVLKQEIQQQSFRKRQSILGHQIGTMRDLCV